MRRIRTTQHSACRSTLLGSMPVSLYRADGLISRATFATRQQISAPNQHSSAFTQFVCRTSVFHNTVQPKQVRHAETGTTPVYVEPSVEILPEDEEAKLTIYEKKFLRYEEAEVKGWWYMKRKKPNRIVKPRRGWMNAKYKNLKIEDVINYLSNERKKYSSLTRDLWLHNYKYKLFPKGIVYLWHLNQIPYGKPWRNLALTKGCFAFLEKVREGKLDKELEEMFLLHPPVDPKEEEAKRLKQEGEERQRDEAAKQRLAELRERMDDDGLGRKKEVSWEKKQFEIVPPPLIPTRVYYRRSAEALQKLKEWKKEQSAQKVEAQKVVMKEREEAWLRDNTPKWLAKQQAEKAAKAAAAAATKGKGKKGK